MLISNDAGEAVAYALWNLEDRGPMMIEPGWKVYRGMIVGEHTRDNDLEVNVLKGKKLTNIRTTSKDEAVRLTPPIRMTLEKALAYIEDDELVEVTPKSIRLRKKLLDPNERKRRRAAQGSRRQRDARFARVALACGAARRHASGGTRLRRTALERLRRSETISSRACAPCNSRCRPRSDLRFFALATRHCGRDSATQSTPLTDR